MESYWMRVKDTEGDIRMTEEELFDLVRKNYCEANKEYIQEQIRVVSEYLTDKQKEELRQKGILT